MPRKIVVRRARRTDAGAVAQLYFETIHRVNARDYNVRQIHAWAPQVLPSAFWRRRWRNYQVWVATEGLRVVGFAEIEPTGRIDCFYVAHDRQARGIGRALMKRIKQEAQRSGTERLRADVSITAQPFFRKEGFRSKRRRKIWYRRCSFSLCQMEKTAGKKRKNNNK